MDALPIRKVPYIGRMIELTLNNLGVNTCKDGIHMAAELMVAYETKKVNKEFLLRSFLGLGRTTHEEEEFQRKSMSVNRTFGRVVKHEEFRAKLIIFAKMLADDLASKNFCGDKISVCFKTTKFEVINVNKNLNTFIWTEEDIRKQALKILDEKWPIEPCRLLGIRLTNLRLVSDVKKDR